ncbi:class IV adenylate cyclase [Kitasatospora sp. NPDC059747]|uniref:class IV adenylate cyclase n=1 Tax=Kitasatospora sp. NPDC059747 TaxID=3346930 RepID=UPI0036542021
MIEAELKALVRRPGAVLRHLEGGYGPGRAEVYRDTSYDTPGGELLDGDRELRIREIEGADGSRRALLTYKGPRVDGPSGSKPEHETAVADAGAAHGIARGLGYLPRLAFEKRCRNYAVERDGRRGLGRAGPGAGRCARADGRARHRGRRLHPRALHGRGGGPARCGGWGPDGAVSCGPAGFRWAGCCSSGCGAWDCRASDRRASGCRVFRRPGVRGGSVAGAPCLPASGRGRTAVLG